MILLEDTRNKVGKHSNIAAYCEKHGIELVRQKLEIGDYMLPDGKIAIDTKRNLDEVAINLMNRNDSARFWREVRRSHEKHIKLVILCECGGQIKSINDVTKWRSKYSKVTGRRLIDEMIRVERAYGTVFKFCSRQSTGKMIIGILTEGVGYGSTSQ